MTGIRLKNLLKEQTRLSADSADDDGADAEADQPTHLENVWKEKLQKCLAADSAATRAEKRFWRWPTDLNFLHILHKMFEQLHCKSLSLVEMQFHWKGFWECLLICLIRGEWECIFVQIR